MKNSQGVHNQVIQHLKESVALNHGELPFSFEAGKVRSAYLRVKALNSAKKATFSDKNLEFFLYVFKTL